MENRRQWEDLGQGKGATIRGPNLCAVTALWKYHLFLAAKGAWPPDCLYLHSEETTQCCLEIPEQTASEQSRIFCFPVIHLLFWSRIHFAQSLIFMLSIWRKAFTDQWVYSHASGSGFSHELVNVTIKSVWFSSLNKVADNSVFKYTHSIPGAAWSKYRRCPTREAAPKLVYSPEVVVVDAIMLNTQTFTCNRG